MATAGCEQLEEQQNLRKQQELNFLKQGPRNLTLLKTMLKHSEGGKTAEFIHKPQSAQDYRLRLSKLHNGMFTSTTLYELEMRGYQRQLEKQKLKNRENALKQQDINKNYYLLRKCILSKIKIPCEIHISCFSSGAKRTAQCKVNIINYYCNAGLLIIIKLVEKPKLDITFNIWPTRLNEMLTYLEQENEFLFEPIVQFDANKHPLMRGNLTCSLSPKISLHFPTELVISIPCEEVIDQHIHEQSTLPYLLISLQNNNIIKNNQCIIQDFLEFLKKERKFAYESLKEKGKNLYRKNWIFH